MRWAFASRGDGRCRRLQPAAAATLLLIPAIIAGGCAGDSGGDHAGDVIVSDSAGVRITLSPATSRTYRTADAEPGLRLGGADEVGPTLFSRITGMRVDGGGNVWVLDGASSEVRIFHPDGTHWKTVGRRGSGPGEFQTPRYLGELADGGIGVWDARLGRYSVISANGDSIRSVNLGAAAGFPLTAVSVYPDGGVLAKQATIAPAGELEPGMLIGDTARLLHLNEDGSRHELVAMAPGPTWLWTGRSQVPLPFTINTPFAVRGQEVLLADGREFRIGGYLAGALTERFGVDRPPRRADDAARAAYRRYLEAIPAGPVRDDYMSALADARTPAWLPAYQALVVAGDGSVWAQQYSPNSLAATAWDVFGPDGAWLGEAQLPAGFVVYQVLGDRVAGVWFDADGVEYVQALRLRASADAVGSRGGEGVR